MAHTVNPSTWKAGRWISEFRDSLGYIVPGQPGLHRVILFQKTKQIN